MEQQNDTSSSISSFKSSDETDLNFDTDKEQSDEELNDKCFKINDIIQCNDDTKVKRLNYLGGSMGKGCSRYMGIDMKKEELVYITEWNISYSQIRNKCSDRCFWDKNKDECIGHTVDDFIEGISRIVKDLSDIRHQNLVAYKCVSCLNDCKKEEVTIYLVQEFVYGCDISCIGTSIGWHTESIKIFVKGILEALAHLQNNDINHNFLYDTTVILDNSGNIRCTDFYLVPQLSEMIGSERKKTQDLPALVKLIEKSVLVLANDIKKFLDRCKLASSPLVLMSDEFFKRSSIQCRIKNEFEELESLGKGGFGKVIKVRNILDCSVYAIKKIPLPSKNTKEYEKIKREVILLSQLKHQNVVGYFNSWIDPPVEDDEMDEVDQGINENVFQIPSFEADKESTSPDGMEFNQSSDNQQNNEMYTNTSLRPKPPRELMYIQMEFCENSTLRRLINSGALQKTLFDETKKFWGFFEHILDGLNYIHKKDIIHRDLKPENIFLDSKDRIKIGDFGLATIRSPILCASINSPNSDTGEVGTSPYIAPEMKNGNDYTNKVDMYSLGIIFFEMSNPHFTTTKERIEVIMSLREENRKIPQSMLKIFNEYPGYGTNITIVRRLLNHNPTERPTGQSLLNWFRSNKISDLSFTF